MESGTHRHRRRRLVVRPAIDRVFFERRAARRGRSFVFFFKDPATTEIYTLSLHDALPISTRVRAPSSVHSASAVGTPPGCERWRRDRKSTRLNSSHLGISYAVFCLKK